MAEKFPNFGGLQYDNVASLMVSSSSPDWFWVGAFSEGSSNYGTIPGPTDIGLSVIRLLIKKDC